MANLLHDKNVAILGGGPAGLTLARLLELDGVSVTVYERDASSRARVQGAPLDLHDESGLKALEAAGLMPAFKQHYMPAADRKKIMNPAGEVLFSDHDKKLAEDFDNPAFRPEIDRGVLRQILLASLKADTVQWGKHALNLTPAGENKAGWQIGFADGSEAYADFVVLSNGANSKLRHYVTDSQPFFTGIVMLEGNIAQANQQSPEIFAQLAGGKIMAFGNEQNILMGQKADNEIGYYLSFKAPADWVQTCGIDFSEKASVLAWYDRTYSDWAGMWRQLIEHATYEFIPRPIYCMPLDAVWQVHSNITLIGDAAHVMPPFAGEGVNMAMLDALQLCNALNNPAFTTLSQAVGHYQDTMKSRAATIAQYSLDNGEKMHSSNALENMLGFFLEPYTGQ